MNDERLGPLQAPAPFNVWKLQLRKDCEQQGIINAFNALTDNVLQLFWKRGIEPTVEALVKDGIKSQRL